jgi:hypothetical protein
MTFQEAKEKLRGIAKGRYHSIQYSITIPEDGQVEEKCELYIDGESWWVSKTWEGAFVKIADSMPPPMPPKEKENITQQPQ